MDKPFVTEVESALQDAFGQSSKSSVVVLSTREAVRQRAAVVFATLLIVLASLALIEYYQATTPRTTITVTVTTTCSQAASQENPLMTFRIDVEYTGSWNATAVGYSNTTANQAFLKCYVGTGNGWILISGWNPKGAAILNLTVQKMDASDDDLTAIGMGQVSSTVAPYGTATISLTAVP